MDLRSTAYHALAKRTLPISPPRTAVDRLDDAGPASPLRAVLDDAVVLARRFDDQLAFARVVGAGLLDVNVLARLAREDRHRRVPVVGRHDRDGVNRLVFQHPAEILDRRRRRRRASASSTRASSASFRAGAAGFVGRLGDLRLLLLAASFSSRFATAACRLVEHGVVDVAEVFDAARPAPPRSSPPRPARARRCR